VKRKQNTIGKAVSFTGNGLHSGLPVKMTLLPAAAGTGIVFRRTDLPGQPEVPARPEFVTDTMRATTLEKGEAKVFTVEHLLSALFALHIDNCVVEMDSPEPPVADGGALTFAEMIREAKCAPQDADIEVPMLEKTVTVYDGDKYIMAIPYDGLRVSFTSVNPHPLLGTQMLDIEINEDTYFKEIAPARTIGFTWELEEMKKMGLGLGGTLENAVVYSEKNAFPI